MWRHRRAPGERLHRAASAGRARRAATGECDHAASAAAQRARVAIRLRSELRQMGTATPIPVRKAGRRHVIEAAQTIAPPRGLSTYNRAGCARHGRGASPENGSVMFGRGSGGASRDRISSSAGPIAQAASAGSSSRASRSTAVRSAPPASNASVAWASTRPRNPRPLTLTDAQSSLPPPDARA